MLNTCRVIQNENGTVTATYTFGDAYAAAIRPIAVNGMQSKPDLSSYSVILRCMLAAILIKSSDASYLHTGTTFNYLRASLLLVQDQTTTQPPPFIYDTTLGKLGFVDPSGGPVTVALTTKVYSCVTHVASVMC